MQIDKDKFVKSLGICFLCPSDMGIHVSKEGKTCGFSVDCKKCWGEALK